MQTDSITMDDWITTVEAAELSGYHIDHIRRLIRGGKIIARKWIRDWQVSRSSVIVYLEEVNQQGGRRGPKPADKK